MPSAYLYNVRETLILPSGLGLGGLELMFNAFYHIEHVVAQFLSLADDIHKEYALLVVIVFIIDIEYVAIAQLVAEVVDLALFVVGFDNT